MSINEHILCITNLGEFESLQSVWDTYPEGGKEGDYIYLGEDLYCWDKYSRSWVIGIDVDSSQIRPINVTYAEGVIDYSEGYINYIGSFDGFEQVWDAYPNGGKDGDYILVAGERYKWNKYISNWGEIDSSEVAPARPVATVWGDLHVHNDAVIGEDLYARILDTFTTKKWVLEQGYIHTDDVTSDIVMSRILTDNETITKKNGRLSVIGNVGGGGVADSVAWSNITGKPLWIGDDKPKYTLSEIIGDSGDGLVTIKGDQSIEGIKDFAFGAKFGGALLRYDSSKKCWIFPNNVLVEGGIAWNTKLEGFEEQTITAAVQVDWKTIGKNENGELCVIGGTSGGGGGSVEGGVSMSEVKLYVAYELTNYAKKGTTLSDYGITDAYTQLQANAKFVDFTTDNQRITGVKNFVNGAKIGGMLLSYNSTQNAFVIPANVIIEGGVAWNSKIDGFSAPTIMDAIQVDGSTISKANGYLEFVGQTSGGTADSVAWSNITGKPTNISGYGITDAYTKDQIDEYLVKKWTRNDQLISNWSAAYSWGNHALAGYAKQGDVTSELGKYVTLATAQTITGIKNFSNGFKVGNVLVSYNASKNAFIFPANAIFEGGIAWNSSIDGFKPQTILDAIPVDDSTISKANGYLEFIGKAGGGVADSVAWGNVTGRPTKLSQFTDDVVSGNYLPIKGIAEGAKALKGLPTSSSWLVAAGNGFNVYNNSSTKRCWFGFSLPEGSPYATTKWVFGASDSSYNAGGEIYANHISLGYGDSTTTGGYALCANGNVKIDGSLTLNGKIISYNASKNAFVLPANVIIEGGIAWNSKLDGFDAPTIMDAVVVDGVTITKENGKLKVIGDLSGGIDETQLGDYLTRNNYAKKSDIPSLSGYATESFVTTRGYITSAAISKANIKSILGISDWALSATSPLKNHGNITSTTDLTALTTGLGYTQGYTPVEGTYNYGQLLNFATYRGQTQIYISDDVSNGGTIHFRTDWEKTKLQNRVWHEILSSKTYTKYAMSLTTDQDVTGVKNYLNGFKVGGNLITYDTSLKAFVLNGNLIVKGGIAWERQNS